ncbi:DNA-binding protein [Bradyrhizobium sp. SSUT112]|uniref:helix-turn-helix transcriptional regulator n=1 Tax=Bradyrhizobium sp. SSUT112 TaxID=3040604 RepID=UPI00244878FA|nr:DNA-binding protein [Bradyrhizobium sp. SSUT112]MDH2357681.1 DNA-binding protein [Bradyrhizobium sp. SSUT112]
MDSTNLYLTGPETKKRYRCSYQTIWRWMNDPELGFPKPMKINGRNRFVLTELDAFDQRHRATEVAA